MKIEDLKNQEKQLYYKRRIIELKKEFKSIEQNFKELSNMTESIIKLNVFKNKKFI